MTNRVYFSIIWRSKRERLFYLLLRRPVNSFAKRLISRAKEIRLIDNHTMHELAGLIDRSLYREYYESGPWLEPQVERTRDTAHKEGEGNV